MISENDLRLKFKEAIYSIHGSIIGQEFDLDSVGFDFNQNGEYPYIEFYGYVQPVKPDGSLSVVMDIIKSVCAINGVIYIENLTPVE